MSTGSIFRRGSFGSRVQWGKHCFVYCGADRCDCGASATPEEREEHEREENLHQALNNAKKINAAKKEEDK